MKKFKIAYFALLGIIGYMGAAASAGPAQTDTLYGYNVAAGTYTAVLPSLEGDLTNPLGWECQSSTETCTYIRPDKNLPISATNRQKVATGTFSFFN